MSPAAARRVDHPLKILKARQVTRGVVREVDGDKPGLRTDVLRQPGRVEAPPVFFIGGPPLDFAPDGQRHLVERLVSGEGADDMVTPIEDGVHGYEYSLHRRGDQDVPRIDPVVQSGDLRAQEGRAGRFRVTEAEPFPELPRPVVRHRQEFRL